MPGQVLRTGALDNLQFAETIGGHGYTEGGLTLNGVSYFVVLLDTPSFVYSSDSVYNPGIVGPAYNPNYPRAIGNEPGTVDIIASVPVTVEESSDSNLSENLNPCPPGNGHLGPSGPCVGNALANLSIDVPGYLILRGYRDPGDDYDTITQANFSAIPQPCAFGLVGIGLLTTFLFKLKKKSIQNRDASRVEVSLSGFFEWPVPYELMGPVRTRARAVTEVPY